MVAILPGCVRFWAAIVPELETIQPRIPGWDDAAPETVEFDGKYCRSGDLAVLSQVWNEISGESRVIPNQILSQFGNWSR